MGNWYYCGSILLDALFLCALLWAALTDIKTRKIPDATSAVVAFIGATATVVSGLRGLSIANHLFGIGLALLTIIPGLLGHMGGGDFKLLLGTGLYLGLAQSLLAVIISVPAMLGTSAYFACRQKATRVRIPLAPVITFGCLGSIAVKWIMIIN